MEWVAVLGLWVTIVTVALWLRRRLTERRRTRERAFEDAEGEPLLPTGDTPEGWLSGWLFRAGYRSPQAAPIFLAATIVMTALGLTAAYAVYSSGITRSATRLINLVPGGVGDLFLPFAHLAPWFAFAVPACLPWLVVRHQRRQRVTQVEQDLPITLELLATLAEAGLGFDSALDRILQSQGTQRPLAQEFRLFQLEVLAGRPRVQCLRRLARRLDVAPVTIFVSALVQADQVGAGMAGVLRQQADDLRHRRREDALSKAASLPIKLLFPLVICFLPGIIVAALGPTFYQIFQLLDNTVRHRGLTP
ncbi:MAG: type II secretion system F family protein [Gemmataceae bacterium]|nr:type II secretion system F family protein [Gemmataceae bacterium]MDW8264066.1 type II secretion system F family protein [Gemmataceae bacterium]